MGDLKHACMVSETVVMVILCSQTEPAASGVAQSAAPEPADAAAAATGMLARVDRTLKDNTAFNGASSEVSTSSDQRLSS